MHNGVAPAVSWQKRSANAGHRSCRGKDPGTRDRNGIVARVKILGLNVMVSRRGMDGFRHEEPVRGLFTAAIRACAEHMSLREHE